MKIRLALGTAAALLPGSLLPAQSIPYGGQLVGNAGPAGMIASLAGRLYTQDIGSCGPAMFRGTTLRFPGTGTGAGGTAYDAARQAVWISDGKDIVLKDLGSRTETCRFTATLNGGKGNFVTGLAHSNRRRQLIQLETLPTPTGSALVLRFYDTTQCPPTLLLKSCTLPIPRGNTAGTAQGLAYDEARDLLFFTTSVPGIGGYSNGLNVIDYGLLCLIKPTEVAVPPFRNCGGTWLNPVSGLAYDSCAQVLYATEGTVTMQLGMQNPRAPVNLNASKPCCKFGINRMIWAGLAYVPESSQVPVGKSCLGTGCLSCPTMQFDISGDLVLGNQNLSLQVSGAPVGSTVSLYLSLGKCGPGIALPGLCGAIHTPVSSGQPLLLGSFPLKGIGGCAGNLQLPTAVPFDRSACGVDFCGQFLVLCPNGRGAGLTHALQFRIGR